MAADGWTIDVALGAHHSFTDGKRPESALSRNMVLDAARAAASRQQLSPLPVSGGGLDLRALGDDQVYREYRVKSAKLLDDGTYDVVCGEGSTLLTPPEPGLFVRSERWVLAYVQNDDHTLDEVIAARVVGHHGNSILHLDLADLVSLSPTTTPPAFTSTDEDLDDLDDDLGLDEGDEGAA